MREGQRQPSAHYHLHPSSSPSSPSFPSFPSFPPVPSCLPHSSTLLSLYQRVLEGELDAAVREDLGPRLWRSFYYPCIETLRRQLQRPAAAEGGGCCVAIHCTSNHIGSVHSAPHHTGSADDTSRDLLTRVLQQVTHDCTDLLGRLQEKYHFQLEDLLRGRLQFQSRRYRRQVQGWGGGTGRCWEVEGVWGAGSH